jgi:Zn-dependent protease with chaperone function
MLWAFLLVAPFLVAGALLTAVTGVFGLIEPGRDPGYRLAFVTVLLLGLGGVAFMLWWTKGLLVLALPVRYEVARSGDTATYSVTLAGVRIRRRRIPLPLEVLEEVYEGRDGWTYRIGVLDGKGRRHELVIPTASGGRDSTARKASRLAERIATPLGAEVRSAS